jgi:hypothetical protein
MVMHSPCLRFENKPWVRYTHFLDRVGGRRDASQTNDPFMPPLLRYG